MPKKSKSDGYDENFNRLTTVQCPKCRKYPIVYNGNFFCQKWGTECDWALSHGDDGEPTNERDRETLARLRASKDTK